MGSLFSNVCWSSTTKTLLITYSKSGMCHWKDFNWSRFSIPNFVHHYRFPQFVAASSRRLHHLHLICILPHNPQEWMVSWWRQIPSKDNLLRSRGAWVEEVQVESSQCRCGRKLGQMAPAFHECVTIIQLTTVVVQTKHSFAWTKHLCLNAPKWPAMKISQSAGLLVISLSECLEKPKLYLYL